MQSKSTLFIAVTMLLIALSSSTFARGGGGHGGGFYGGGSWHGDADVDVGRSDVVRGDYYGGAPVVVDDVAAVTYAPTCTWVPAHYDSQGYYVAGQNVCQ